MVDLTADEAALLMIADHGQYVMPIGRWEPGVKSLIAKGLMINQPQGVRDPTGKFNVVITNEGRKALQQFNDQTDEDLRLVSAAREETVAHVETAARFIANAAKASARVTGDTLASEAHKWSKAVLERALQIIGESQE